MSSQPNFESYNFIRLRTKNIITLPPIQHSKKTINQPEDIQNPNDQSGKNFNFDQEHKDHYQGVPIIKITKKNRKIILNQNNEKKDKQIIARGILVDFNKSIKSFKDQLEFIGNFQGVFETYPQHQHIYFEGEITELKILKLNGEELTVYDNQEMIQLTHIRGYFKGKFISRRKGEQNKEDQEQESMEELNKQHPDEGKKTVQYHIPAMVRMDIRKIAQINLQKSSADIVAQLKIDIQLNQQVLKLLNDNDQQKYELCIDFHRGKPFLLPFYDPKDNKNSDQEIQDNMQSTTTWKQQQMRMSYRIKAMYTAEIDNSHGIFYAPFHLNVLKIILDFHSIKVDSKTKICINCCELTDYNNNIPYTPYTCFNNLQRDLLNRSKKQQIYKKHIDRLNKIDTTLFVDQGEFKIANNRLSLFPYYKRVFQNKHTITSRFSWTLGIADKDSLLKPLTAQSVKSSYQDYQLKHKDDDLPQNKDKKHQLFKLHKYQFVHIQIPIFKYPVIDIIRIFVPITILSVISMTMFWQESGLDSTGFTELAKRITSGFSIIVAYVALIPLIRSNFPPTPSITLIQILIYLSVIPNILAVLSTLVTHSGYTNEFFRTYKPFVDSFFLVSFMLCCVSLLILTITIITYVMKDQKVILPFKNLIHHL